jgi:hypothetical protein
MVKFIGNRIGSSVTNALSQSGIFNLFSQEYLNRSSNWDTQSRYHYFTSPGSIDVSSYYPKISRIDFFGVTGGGGGGSGAPGIPRSADGGAGGTGGSSGTITVYLNAPKAPYSPGTIPVSVGSNFPTPVSGPNPGPGGSVLSVPQSIKTVFSSYGINTFPTAATGYGEGGFAGDGGFGGAGGVAFNKSTSEPAPLVPEIPFVQGTKGSNGNYVVSAGGNAIRTGGEGGDGGFGYGGGGGGGGGGAEYDGNTSSGGPGQPGSPGLIVVKITYQY